MKRKIMTLMTALTLSVSLSACGDKTALQADTASVEETTETSETTEEVAEESTPEEEPAPEITPEEKVQSAIGEMPYYGDTASCKMTAEQATAFAQLIADGLAGDFSFRGGYDELDYNILTWSEPFQVFNYEMGKQVEIDRFNIMLGDFGNHGIPYLYVYSSQEPSSFEVYGWNGSEPILSISGEIGFRTDYMLSEQEDGTVRFVSRDFNAEVQCGDEILWAAILWEEYAFTEGNSKQVCERALAKSDPLDDSDSFYIIENGEMTGECTDKESEAFLEKEIHNHTLPYTCFYDMTPCTLEEMVNYLNAYASVMSDGQSVPVEIKKVDIVKHDGTGIITKGEVPQEKVDSLEILRQYMNGEQGIGCVNDGDSLCYINGFGEEWEGTKNFYFGLADLSNDSNPDILVSYKDDGRNWGYTNLYLGSSYKDGLSSINGINRSDGTYLCTGGSIFAVAYLYVYDGTAFSIISTLEESEALNGDGYAEGYQYTLTENGTTRTVSEEEFYSIWNDWESKHTDLGADTHLDIENIENTFQVKIDVQSSGEWLVTNAE